MAQMTDKYQSTVKEADLGKEIKQITKHSFVYGTGTIVNRVIGFVMIPVYTRYLVPFEYGIIELVAMTTEIVGMILSMRISRAMYRFYFEYDSAEDRNEIISTAMLSFGGIGLVGILLASLISDFLAENILNSSRYSFYFIISFTTLWFNTVIEIAFYYLMILKKSVLYIILASVKLILALSFNIYFIVFLKMGVLGMLYGNLIASISLTVILVLPILIRLGIRFSRKKLTEMLKYGLPLIPGSLANFVVLVSDRYIVKIFGSLSDVGIYSLSYRFGLIPHRLITEPFNQIWGVRRFELMKRDDAEELFGKIIIYFVFLVTFLGLGISVLAKDTLYIIADNKFWDAYKYIPVLVLSYIVYSLYFHFAMGIYLLKKTKYISYIDILNGVINVLLNIFLIKAYGMYGAAYATLISYTTRIVMLYLVSSRLHKIYFEFARALKILFSAGLIFSFCSFITLHSPVINLFIKCVIICLFPVILYVCKFYSDSELSKVKMVLAKRSLRAVFT